MPRATAGAGSAGGRKAKKARVSQKSKAAAAAAAAAAVADQEPAALYGLYSTSYSDFCSGAWFPANYVGPAPPDPVDDASAAAAAAAGSAPAPSDHILVRWQSKHTRYAPERLSLAFVRGGSEFVPLPAQHMRADKRVLVRDVLEDLDFSGVSFWLATLKSDPPAPAAAAAAAVPASAGGASGGKKRSSSQLATPMITVQYQNTLWPESSVPLSSIYVLPKLKGQLNLVPEPPHEGDDEDDDEEDGDEVREEEQKVQHHPSQPQQRHSQEGEEQEEGGTTTAASASYPAAAAASAAAAAAAATAGVSTRDDPSSASFLAPSSPSLPFAFSSPTPGVASDFDLRLSPPTTSLGMGPGLGVALSHLQQQLPPHASQLTDSDRE